ncbi:Uncharacterized protein TCM_044519 [Theobroma cacao]|uniref:Uncharacterized protein n=1 Tax=Theobroma cacao TaxID=3641 RepID=A0A061FX84_THECC|nr:Uncharacterized protein TCM_044519 [Theobroma cacao]
MAKTSFTRKLAEKGKRKRKVDDSSTLSFKKKRKKKEPLDKKMKGGKTKMTKKGKGLVDAKTTTGKGIFLRNVLKKEYKIDRNECIKVTEGTPLPPLIGSPSTPFTRASQPPLQSDMMFNIFMRIDGKTIDQAEKIEEKLQHLKALLHPTKETKSLEAPTTVTSQSSERTTTEQFEIATSDHEREAEKEILENKDVNQNENEDFEKELAK